MLWEKSSVDSMYIDLLKNVTYPLRNRWIYRRKDNIMSVNYRNQGNVLYKKGEFAKAWTQYNESVCFAESESEHLALAYSNRSQCFLKLKMYERCLNDIKTIKEHCRYPEHLKPKLDARQRDCGGKFDPIQQISEPFLSFPADDVLPNMSNVVQIEYNPTYGRMLRAKCDLAVGHTVLIETVYIRGVNCDVNNFCTHCGKKNMNFVPCGKCAGAAFCNKDCLDNSSHNIECDMMLGTDNTCDQQSLTTIIRSVLTSINLFTTTEEMIQFVENLRSAEPFEITHTVSTPESKYRTFFNLATFATSQRVLDFRKRAYFVFHAIMSSAQHAHKFETIDAKRFLVHLIIHHGLTINSNAFSFEEDNARVEEVLLLGSYINHSCLPNVAKMTKNNISLVKTILPISEGEQLFVTYISDEVFDMTERQRNDFLYNFYGFRCKCSLCLNGRVRTDALSDDPSFVYVSSNVLNDDFVHKNLPIIIKHCVDFLQRYPNMSGSKEIAYIADTLTALFSKQLNG